MYEWYLCLECVRVSNGERTYSSHTSRYQSCMVSYDRRMFAKDPHRGVS